MGTSWANYIDGLCDFFEIAPEELVKNTFDITQENIEPEGNDTIF